MLVIKVLKTTCNWKLQVVIWVIFVYPFLDLEWGRIMTPNLTKRKKTVEQLIEQAFLQGQKNRTVMGPTKLQKKLVTEGKD